MLNMAIMSLKKFLRSLLKEFGFLLVLDIYIFLYRCNQIGYINQGQFMEV